MLVFLRFGGVGQCLTDNRRAPFIGECGLEQDGSIGLVSEVGWLEVRFRIDVTTKYTKIKG
jgi:hypothetical protein